MHGKLLGVEVSAFGLTDDTTVLVVDILPTPNIDFKDISKKIRGPRQLLSKWRGSMGRNVRPLTECCSDNVLLLEKEGYSICRARY